MSNSISGPCTSCSGGYDASAPKSAAKQARQALDVGRVDASSERSGTLKIKTDEGDTVTISFAAKNALSYTSGISSVGGSTAQQTNSTASSSLEYSIDVQGNLSKKEVADIGKLLKRLTASIQQPQANRGRDERNLGSLQSFQFVYQQSDQLAYSTLSVSA